MKRLREFCCRLHLRVAPRAGAWIETIPMRPLLARARVAPRAGAWIETQSISFLAVLIVATPPRGGRLSRGPAVVA